jgi:serine/threonine-protein kinase
MPIDSVATLVTQLNQSGLLQPPQLAEVTRQLQPRFQDPRALARHLIDRGWLTPLHINALFQGRGKDLVIGPYVLLERVGEGGMGQVFKARHQKLGKIVALKVIRKEWLAQPEAVRRFQREMQAASKLAHPNIVHAFDADQIGDTHLIAMEFVEGVDLARLVKEKGPLPIPTACDFIRQAALGLQHAFERGMVHRDIKPSNLLLTRAAGQKREGPWGTIKILDMGLARVPRPDDVDTSDSSSGTITHAGCVVGTPDYIAPEQARDSHRVDIRADLYSLGCSFYLMLTGQVPFPGGTGMEKLFKHQLDVPTPVTNLRPDLPPELAAVVDRLLAKAPEQRYQTPIEVTQAVEAFIVAPGSSAVQALRPTRTTKQDPTEPEIQAVPMAAPVEPPRRRSKRWVAALALLLLGGVALAVAKLGPDHKADTSTATNADVASPARPLLDQLDGQIPPAERIPGLPPEVVAVLGEHRLRGWGFTTAVVFSPDGSRLAIASQRSVRIWDTSTGHQRAALALNTSHGMSLAFMPDGKTLATLTGNDMIRTWDIGSGKQLEPRHSPSETTAVALAPDGRSAVFADKPGSAEPRLRLWDLTENRQRVSLGPSGAGSFVTYAANGKCLVVGNRNLVAGVKSELVLWDPGTGKELGRLPLPEKEPLVHAAVAGDGATVAFSTARRIEAWNVVRKEKLVGCEGQNIAVRLLLLSPDGQTLVTSAHQFTPEGGFKDQVRVWNTGTGQERPQPATQLSGVNLAAFAPDNQTVAFSSFGAKVTLWDLAANRDKLPSAGHRGNPMAISFAADNRSVVSVAFGFEPEVKLWELLPARERSTIAESPVMTTGQQVAPDGRIIVTRSKQGLMARDAATGQELGKLALTGAEAGAAIRSSNGKAVALYRPADGTIQVWEVPSFRPLAAIAAAAPQTPFLWLTFSGDGQTLAALDPKGKLRLWTTATGKERPTTLPALANQRMPMLNRDGTLLAVHDDGAIKVWDVASGQQRFTHPFTANRGQFFTIEFAPAGDVLLAYHHTAALVLDTATGKEKLSIRPSGDMFQNVSLSADGKQLVSTEPDGRLIVWDVGSGREVRQIMLPGPVSRVAFAADGRHLATANSNGTIYIARVTSGGR